MIDKEKLKTVKYVIIVLLVVFTLKSFANYVAIPEYDNVECGYSCNPVSNCESYLKLKSEREIKPAQYRVLSGITGSSELFVKNVSNQFCYDFIDFMPKKEYEITLRKNEWMPKTN